MAKNVDTNPCDNDLDRTKTVEKVQLRRGRLIDLPQPLKAGEIGWAMDAQRLFIGTTCEYTPSGVQVVSGHFNYVQSLIDNRIIRVALSSSFTDNEWQTTKNNINSSHPDIVESLMQYDGDTTVLIGMPDGFTDVSALISTIEGQDGVITPVTVGAGYQVNLVDGGIEGINYVISGMLAHILNFIADDGVAHNMLNVPIVTGRNIDTEKRSALSASIGSPDGPKIPEDFEATTIASGDITLDGNWKIINSPDGVMKIDIRVSEFGTMPTTSDSILDGDYIEINNTSSSSGLISDLAGTLIERGYIVQVYIVESDDWIEWVDIQLQGIV